MAVALPHDGYNIFAVGTSGLGKRTMIKRLLKGVAAKRSCAFGLVLRQ
jgi:guanylate kinase